MEKNKKTFYMSSKWSLLRNKIIKKYGRSCMRCGDTQCEIHVDHIKPRSLYPHLSLCEDNLQILCKVCNIEKSNIDNTDYRLSIAKKAFVEIKSEITLKSKTLTPKQIIAEQLMKSTKGRGKGSGGKKVAIIKGYSTEDILERKRNRGSFCPGYSSIEKYLKTTT